MKRLSTRRMAFTLVELIVVLGILAILMVLVVPRITGYIHDARLTAARSNAAAVMDAAQLYIIDQETDNISLGKVTTLTSGGDLDAYLEGLGEDHYSITITYDDAAKRYDFKGEYTSNNTVVNIPELTVSE